MNVKIKLIILSISMNICISENMYSQGILLSEYRMILESKDIRTIQVCNPTDKPRTYILSLIDKDMGNLGVFTDIPDTVVYEYSLRKNLRIFPKSFTLEPRDCQEVQIQVKKIKGLKAGEYRSYINFWPRLLPSQEKDTIQNGVQMKISFQIMTAIPIIFRKNTHLESVSIDRVYLSKNDNNKPFLHLTVHKKGNRSIYGSILVEAMIDEKLTSLNSVNNVVIYAQIERGDFKIPIDTDTLQSDAGGQVTLKVSFLDGEDKSASKQKVLMSQDIKVKLLNKY